MRMNNKGFSLAELLAVVAIMGILCGVAIESYTRYSESSKKKAYQYLVVSAENAMEEYLMDNPFAEEATLEELYENDYLERPNDPGNNGGVCKGEVRLEEDTSSIDSDTSLKKYTVILCCNNYNYTYTNHGNDLQKNDSCAME